MAIEVRIPTILRTLHRRREGGRGLGRHAARAHRRPRDAPRRDLPTGSSTTAALRRFVNVYVNDEDVRFLDGLDTALSDGDVVTILPAVAGG